MAALRYRSAAAMTLAALVSSAASGMDFTGSIPEVRPFGANSFRIRFASPGFNFSDALPLAPFLDTPLSGEPPVPVSAGGRAINGNLQLDVDPNTGYITATRISDGVVVYRQTALTYALAAIDGIPPSAQAVFDGPAQAETLVGFGEQGLTGRVTAQFPFNRVFADTEYYPYNQGRQAFFPLYFSSAGYGVLFALPSYGFINVDHGADGIVVNSSSIRVFDFWITTTAGNPVYAAGVPHPFLQLLAQYADAVGYAPPMPAFAAGFIASKDRYHNQSQFLAVARGYLDRGIPLSLLTVDWFHWRALGDMSLNPDCWPDPQAMVDELRENGIEIMITHWPFMSTASVHRAEYEAAGALAINRKSGEPDMFWQYLQNGSLIMPYSQAARNRTFGHWMDGYGRYGVRAVWLDETEPDRAAYSYGEWTYEGLSDLEVGAAWKTQWLRTMTDGLRAQYGVGNYFLLSRSGWAGTAKMGHAVWSGDSTSDWETLALQIPTGLGAGLSGIGLWTHDIGGYNPTMQPLDPKLQELLVRWFQLGSVSPLMRLHGHRNGGPAADPVCMQTNGDNEPWTLVDTPSEAYDAIVAAIRWRDQQRNYVVDLQAAWAATNAPMIAPVWLLFPGDAVCAFTPAGDEPACAGEFMFGPDWLAKPVTRYLQRSAWVYLPALPAGQTWVYYFNGTSFGAGGANVTVNAALSEFPLFYRQRQYAQPAERRGGGSLALSQ